MDKNAKIVPFFYKERKDQNVLLKGGVVKQAKELTREQEGGVEQVDEQAGGSRAGRGHGSRQGTWEQALENARGWLGRKN